MTTCRDIVNGALRKIGRLGAGREPRLADSQDALEALRGLYRSLINSGAFGVLRDVIPAGSSYTAGENERVFRNSDATLSITLPEVVAHDWCGPRPYDEECDCGAPAEPTAYNQRPPRDCAVVVICDAFTAATVEYLYDGQQKLWTALYGLELDDVAPLAYRDPEGLKCLLAMQIVDEFGGVMGEMTARSGFAFQSSLITKFSTPDRPVIGVYV